MESWITQSHIWTPSLKLADYRNVNKDTEVIIVPLPKLRQQKGADYNFLERVRFRFLICDESHQWVRGQRKLKKANQLELFRSMILPKAKATFHLSGTPFPYTMSFDMVETIKSLATNIIRSNWKFTYRCDAGEEERFAYDDASLAELQRNWENFSSAYKSQMLIPIMMRRTKDSVDLKGNKIIPDHFKDLKYVDDGAIKIKDIGAEIKKRDGLMERFGMDNRSIDRYSHARWLAYSSWLLTHDWKGCGRENKTWWDKFTLDDAMEFERGRRLIQLLQKYRREGKRPIVFAYAVFHQQFAAKVPPRMIYADMM
jgi:hypothetical protein